jgi:hypothetical protein
MAMSEEAANIADSVGLMTAVLMDQCVFIGGSLRLVVRHEFMPLQG